MTTSERVGLLTTLAIFSLVFSVRAMTLSDPLLKLGQPVARALNRSSSGSDEERGP